MTQEYSDATQRLLKAREILLDYDCGKGNCVDCPMRFGAARKCLVRLVSRHAISAKLKEDYNDNH